MRIICPKCGTEYFLESGQLEQDGTPVQCSACEHTFTVYAPTEPVTRTPRSHKKADAPTPEQVSRPQERASRPPDPPPPPPRASASVMPPPPPQRRGSATLFLAQGDRVYKVKDIATLQRWIVEKRVLPGDRISNDGKSWEVVTDRSDLRAFFAIIEQLKSARRELKHKTREMKAVEDGAAVPDGSDESTVRPPTGQLAESGAIPDVVVVSGSHALQAAEPPQDAGSSLSGEFDGHGPESVPHLASVPAEAEASGGHFFTASPDSLSASATDLKGEEEESFAASAAVDIQPADEAMSSANMMATRPVPVQNPTPHPADASPASAPTPTGPTPAIDTPSPAATRSDYDPDQTFDDFVEPKSNTRFYVGLLALLTLVVGAMWWFMMGPGRSAVFDETGEVAVAANTGDATEEPVTTAEPTPVVDEDPELPTAEPETGPATDTPTPTPVAATSTPRVEPSTPRPTPTPAPERSTPAPRAESADKLLADGDRARDRGNFRQAADAYSGALEADPKSFRAALQLGWMNVELGRNTSAEAAFGKALKLRASSAEARYGLGLAYQAGGKTDKAIAAYERALELDPEGRDAREIRAILAQLQ